MEEWTIREWMTLEEWTIVEWITVQEWMIGEVPGEEMNMTVLRRVDGVIVIVTVMSVTVFHQVLGEKVVVMTVDVNDRDTPGGWGRRDRDSGDGWRGGDRGDRYGGGGDGDRFRGDRDREGGDRDHERTG